MSTLSASPADAAAPAAAEARPLIWDAPVRVFHWLMALSFAGAYLTAESESWRLVHVTLGYTMAGLVVFRLLWGVVGTRHARFADFVRGPSAVLRYARSLVAGRPEHHVGHNPAGALAIVALLALALGVAGSGWALYNDIAGEAFEEVHEVVANLMLGLVAVHIGAVLLSSWLHRENLVGAMITGRKPAPREQGVARARRGVALLLLASVLGFWAWQWQTAPAGGALPGIGTERHHGGDRDDD
jgi:cytochrome b